MNKQSIIEKLKETYSFFSKIKFGTVKKNDNILIFGISRGGTTMLAEALVALFDARLVWEPLFPHRAVFLKTINPFSTHRYNALRLGWNPHVSKLYEAEVHGYFENLFALKERNIRFFRFSDYDRFSNQEHTVFKFCFANFMYPYFNQKFGMKSIVLLRHPFAIAASSLNFGTNYDWHKKNYGNWKYSDTTKSAGFFEQLNQHIDLIDSAFTLLVYQAVAQFSYVLNNLNKENTVVVYYEDLVVSQDHVLNDLESFFGKTLDRVIFKSALSKQSFSSKKGHTHTDAMAQLSKWKQKCSVKDVEQGLRIFEAFDFKAYSDAVLPLKQ